MRDIFDKIILSSIIITLSTSWLWYMGMSIPYALAISVTLAVATCVIVYKSNTRIPLRSYISYLRELEDTALYSHIAQYVNVGYEVEAHPDHLSISDGSVVVALLNYGGASKDYIANLSRRYKDTTRIYLVTPHDLKGLLVYSRVEIVQVHPKTLLKKVAKSDFTLPEGKKKKINLNGIFSRDRAKYYLLSGIALLLNVFFYTPYRTYYMIIGSLCLTSALFCLFSPSTPRSPKIFE